MFVCKFACLFLQLCMYVSKFTLVPGAQLCACVCACVCVWPVVEAEASSSVSHGGASGAKRWTLTDSSVLLWPCQRLLCLGLVA